MFRFKRPVFDAETLARLHEQSPCTHCGGIHAVSCPRVRSMEFDGDGRLRRVEFWPHWDTRRVVYPEDLPPPPPTEGNDEG